MSDDPAHILASLTALMNEETALLERGEWPLEIGALAAAKQRLIGKLEVTLAARDRAMPEWSAMLSPKDRAALDREVGAVRIAAERNADAVKRQIDLSQDLIDAIAAEARRMGGTRQQTYRRSGAVDRRDGAAPVAVNTSL